MDQMFTDRSIRKALNDTAVLLEKMKLRKNALYSVSVDRYGDASVHVEPHEFIRLYQIARPRPNARSASVSEAGDLHVVFHYRKTRFTAMVRKDSPEFAALAACQGRIESRDTPRLACSAV